MINTESNDLLGKIKKISSVNRTIHVNKQLLTAKNGNEDEGNIDEHMNQQKTRKKRDQSENRTIDSTRGAASS